MKNVNFDFNQTFIKAVQPLSGVVLQSKPDLNQLSPIKVKTEQPNPTVTNKLTSPTSQKEKKQDNKDAKEKRKKKDKKKKSKKKRTS